ncbi:MAG: thio(seleno)oxazole modification radical SAM maturase SbtM [Desulfobulbaceae bacterium]|nr:thio(seleno)oxazole modification radical SAM maturase SbtM [Desulfobulbaceae bacterium]
MAIGCFFSPFIPPAAVAVRAAPMDLIQSIYPICSRIFGSNFPITADEQRDLSLYLADHPELISSHPFLADLAKLEEMIHNLPTVGVPPPSKVNSRMINPKLLLIELGWRGLPDLLKGRKMTPRPERCYVLVWQKPGEEIVRCAEASSYDLLALKLVEEEIDSRDAACQAGVTVGQIDDALYLAEQKGLLIDPPSRIVRPSEFKRELVNDPKYFTTPTFTLQWHITQSCDLHCRHCYDRSEMQDMEPDQCIRVLDDLYVFCRQHHVFTQVTFTGGNPLLYPHFNRIYLEAVDRGFITAILGNPMPEKRIKEMCAIRKPEFYQVSLEGLREHNDFIRGRGHFDRVLEFLEVLRDHGVYSMVMLTLTRANMDQVFDVAELLRDKVDLFTFNRLAMVGEGTALESVSFKAYRGLVGKYIEAAKNNPCMRPKDNLINLYRLEAGQPLFGGCAGRGCGAAFNFAALLPSGEVHACRKFPSLIGNINTHTLDEIYYGERAAQYRSGPAECSQCSIRPICGGCLAVAHGFGLDIFKDKDPYCWY